jgi:hypothetical protein
METHKVVGKDTLPRGVAVFCECGSTFYAPFAQINARGMARPGDLESAMYEADLRWQKHAMNGASRLTYRVTNLPG